MNEIHYSYLKRIQIMLKLVFTLLITFVLCSCSSTKLNKELLTGDQIYTQLNKNQISLRDALLINTEDSRMALRAYLAGNPKNSRKLLDLWISILQEDLKLTLKNKATLDNSLKHSYEPVCHCFWIDESGVTSYRKGVVWFLHKTLPEESVGGDWNGRTDRSIKSIPWEKMSDQTRTILMNLEKCLKYIEGQSFVYTRGDKIQNNINYEVIGKEVARDIKKYDFPLELTESASFLCFYHHRVKLGKKMNPFQ